MGAAWDWSELVRGTNELSVALYKELVEENPGNNLLVSPVSISMALALAYAGARGETRESMRQPLRYPIDDDELHSAFRTLRGELNRRGEAVDEDLPPGTDAHAPGPFELTLANAVWGQAGYPFRDGYLATVETDSGGEFRVVDFRSDPDGACREINAWVADRTEDRIPNLLPDGSVIADSRLVLTSAVYFLARWNTPFQDTRTRLEAFTPLDGATLEVPMMHQSGEFRYAEHAEVQVVELPYVGQEVSMVVVLPPPGEFTVFEETFDDTALAHLLGDLEDREGHVGLPRFEFDSRLRLREPLKSLGMTTAFHEADADFAGIAHLGDTEPNLFIDDVIHGTYIAVDERQTEASAATATVGVMSAPPPEEEPFEFIADRPFLFAIRDAPTDAVLFLGRVVAAGAFDDGLDASITRQARDNQDR